NMSEKELERLRDAREVLFDMRAEKVDRVKAIEKLGPCPPPPPRRTETPPTGGPLNMAPPLTPPDGLYAGGKAGWTHLGTVDAVTHFEDGTATDRDHHAEGFDVGGRVGIKNGPWRSEVEFNYRRNGLDSITAGTDPKASGST